MGVDAHGVVSQFLRGQLTEESGCEVVAMVQLVNSDVINQE